MGVKHPLEMSKKDYKHDKRHEKGGLNLKKKIKKTFWKAGRDEEETEKAGENMVTGQIEMWEYRICILFKY